VCEEAIREALKNSIVLRTEISDVPVAAFLSGGLDTSAVVAFASKARSERLQRCCMGFREHTHEFSDAKLVAEEIGTVHHELLIEAGYAMHVFPRRIWHSEMPKVNLYSRWYTMAWMMLGLDLWYRIFIDEHAKELGFLW
jgi:asparagine synthase (glutamine-hydrolysing)